MTALFQNILTASFHGSIVIAVVLLLRLLLKKAPRKYICYLWLLAGLRLLMPFEIQSDLSLQPQSPPDTMIRWEAPAPMRPAAEDAMLLPGQAPAAPEASPEQPEAAAPSVITPEQSMTFSDLLPCLWLGVAAVFLVYSLAGYISLRRKVRDATPIPGGWESEGIDTAFILGFIRPQIYIPLGMAPVTRKHILAHERTHLDKGDHWIKMIGFLALALHWFNPLVWAAYILLCKDIEMACDERVVQFMDLRERKEYSKALLNCSTNRIHYAASPVAFGEVSVKIRIQSILRYRKPSFWVGLLSVLAIAFVTVCLVTSPTAPPAEGGSPSLLDSLTATPVKYEFTPATQPPMEENPDWGLVLKTEVLSPTAMTLYYGVDVNQVPWDGTPILLTFNYWLETWNGETWEKVPGLAQSAPESSSTFSIELSKENLHSHYDTYDYDWSLVYGALPEGDYRIALRPIRNGEAKPHYAWFHVYSNALTGEEAEAVDRCESALDKLLLSDNYACTIQESNEWGSLMPVQNLVKTNRQGKVEFYYGDLCYGTYYCEATDLLIAQWSEAFYPPENAFLSFPKGESILSDDQVRFVASWVDMDGVTQKKTCTYSFAADGTLSGIDMLTQFTAEDGVATQNQRSVTIDNAYWGDTTHEDLTPKDSFDEIADSPWGIFFRIDDDLLKPSAGDIWMATGSDNIGVSNFTTDSSYWLERKIDGSWKKLTPREENPNWGDKTYQLTNRTTIVDQMNWTRYYGELEAGLYRMGKHFWKGEESTIQYAEFAIHPKGGVQGPGSEEALARVNAALEKLRNGNYCIIQNDNSSMAGEDRISHIHWKYDGLCVTDYYDYQNADGYRHSALQTADSEYADLFYDMWINYFNWDDDYCLVMFSEGMSLVSDERITFASTYTSNNNAPNLTTYDFFFDKDGNITRMEITMQDPYGYITKTILEVQEKSDEEIAAWVNQIKAQQS